MDDIKVITIKDNEEFLRQQSKKVDINDLDLKDNIKVLDDYCKKHDVLAMAAVQLGIPKRLIYLKNTNLELVNKYQSDSLTEEEHNYNEEKVLINPKIIKKEGLTDYWEACASCLDNLGHIKRPYKITLEYYDIEGNKHLEIFEGFETTVLSHEMDHLDGILHMDIADEVLNMSREERKKFRQSHGYNIIYKEGNFEKLKIKKFPGLYSKI